MKSGEKLSPDFKEFLSLLLEEKAEFVIVGGYAVNYHGYSRYTGDMDVLLARSPENADKILKVLNRFGFGNLSISAADLQVPDSVLQLGRAPVRIDLITSLTGVENEEVFSDCVQASFYGLKVPVISKATLIKNKRAIGRTQDLLDIEKIP